MLLHGGRAPSLYGGARAASHVFEAKTKKAENTGRPVLETCGTMFSTCIMASIFHITAILAVLLTSQYFQSTGTRNIAKAPAFNNTYKKKNL